jgi:hypothetical protein
VNTRRNLILLGIALTVIPSTFCLVVLGAGNLSSGTTIGLAILVALPALVVIGGMIGYGTSTISPNKWLVVLGSQIGWLGGLLTVGLIQRHFQIPPGGILLAVGIYTLWICIGVLAGLAPALVARYINGVK